MNVVSDIVDADTPTGTMAILSKRPAGNGPWPRIVMFHDGPGIRNATHEFMTKLAGEGYEVLTPDLFHRHGRMIGYEPDEREADPSLGQRMWDLILSVGDDTIQADLDATVAALEIPVDEPLGVIGFCLGARAVFRTLIRFPTQFVAGAMWHPSFLVDETSESPHLTAASLAQPLYIGIGTADKMQSIAMHQPFFDAVEPLSGVEVEIFEGADHGYTWPGWSTYHQVASDGSFAKTKALFAQNLDASV